MALKLMKGCEAISEAAIQAGCRYFFGYPITPQNEIPEYMSHRMPTVGGVFVQAESELAAINMVYGAAAAGMRVMTSSSSPGISLKQEGISYLAATELPAVIMNVNRGGPGLGTIQPSQADYYQATRGGGNGDYRVMVFAPSSLQETVDIVQESFDIADQYRIPVMFLLIAFIFMVSNQVIDIESSEIAMLKSRGVSRLQLILTYLLQSSILGGIALVIGIPFGYILCHVFGSTNAFLEFVGRKSMSVRITGESLLYAIVSCVCGILIMTLPVLKFARFSIVEQKAHKRKKNKPLWQRMFLDFALLALALYGFYDFNNQKDELMKAIAKGEAVNPMLFFSASLFILSCAIVFLRVIPLLSSLIFKIGRKAWKPAEYASFLQITRDIHKQSPFCDRFRNGNQVCSCPPCLCQNIKGSLLCNAAI